MKGCKRDDLTIRNQENIILEANQVIGVKLESVARSYNGLIKVNDAQVLFSSTGVTNGVVNDTLLSCGACGVLEVSNRSYKE